MSNSKHTPGPWRLIAYEGKMFITAGRGKKETQIADVSDIEIDRGDEVETDIATMRANGQLLAMAPRLLAMKAEADALAADITKRHQRLLAAAKKVCDLDADDDNTSSDDLWNAIEELRELVELSPAKREAT